MVFGNATTSLFEGLWLFLCERIILIWLRGLILYFQMFLSDLLVGICAERAY